MTNKPRVVHTKKKEAGNFFKEVPGLTPRDQFFIELGQALVQAINPKFDDARFTLAAPDREARLLGEIALDQMVELLAPSSAAVRLREHVDIVVGKKSRALSAVHMSAATPAPRKLH